MSIAPRYTTHHTPETAVAMIGCPVTLDLGMHVALDLQRDGLSDTTPGRVLAVNFANDWPKFDVLFQGDLEVTGLCEFEIRVACHA